MEWINYAVSILSGLAIAIPLVIKLVEYVQKSVKEKNWNKLLDLIMRLMSEAETKFETGADKKEWVLAMVKASADTQVLKDNTKMTEEMFVQNSRDRIIDFATKVSVETNPVSREEFNRIFKVHTRYEKFLDEHEMTNGEVDIAYRIIQEAYEHHMKNHSFVEDVRGYNN